MGVNRKHIFNYLIETRTGKKNTKLSGEKKGGVGGGGGGGGPAFIGWVLLFVCLIKG